MPAQAHSPIRRAFTIVELLVAVGVTAILVTLMVTITINVLNAWNRSSGSLTAGNQARLVLDQLSQDLQGAIIRRDSNAWLVATVQQNQSGAGDSSIGNWSSGTPKPGATSDSLLIDPPSADEADLENPNFLLGIENYRFGQAGVWLRFFSTPSDNTNATVEYASAPRAISYQMVRRRIGSASSQELVYTLYRSEVRPAATSGSNSTFGAGYDLLMAGGYNGTSSTAQGDVSNVRRPTDGDIIANDVIDFGIKLYGRDTGGAEVELFPIQRNAGGNPQPPATDGDGMPLWSNPPTAIPFSFAVSSPTSSSGNFVTGGGQIVYGYPTAADVMVRILSPEGVRLIQAIERGDLTGVDWWDTAIQNSQVYTRRIEIKSKGL